MSLKRGTSHDERHTSRFHDTELDRSDMLYRQINKQNERYLFTAHVPHLPADKQGCDCCAQWILNIHFNIKRFILF